MTFHTFSFDGVPIMGSRQLRLLREKNGADLVKRNSNPQTPSTVDASVVRAGEVPLAESAKH
jgi:hypothetical protein